MGLGDIGAHTSGSVTSHFQNQDVLRRQTSTGKRNLLCTSQHLCNTCSHSLSQSLHTDLGQHVSVCLIAWKKWAFLWPDLLKKKIADQRNKKSNQSPLGNWQFGFFLLLFKYGMKFSTQASGSSWGCLVYWCPSPRADTYFQHKFQPTTPGSAIHIFSNGRTSLCTCRPLPSLYRETLPTFSRAKLSHTSLSSWRNRQIKDQ